MRTLSAMKPAMVRRMSEQPRTSRTTRSRFPIQRRAKAEPTSRRKIGTATGAILVRTVLAA